MLTQTTILITKMSIAPSHEFHKLDFSEPTLSRECLREMEKHSKFDQKDLVDYYDSVAENYEGVYLRAGYPDPKKVAEFAHKTAIRDDLNIKESKVLDFGCGTGLVGKYMSENGFDKIDGLDASQAMLNEAAHKGIYHHLEKVLLC